jgi:hypothetical protein
VTVVETFADIPRVTRDKLEEMGVDDV